MSAWANGFGVWHVRVPADADSHLAAIAALRDEIEPREAHASPLVWNRPVRVPDLDDDTTRVYREGDPD